MQSDFVTIGRADLQVRVFGGHLAAFGIPIRPDLDTEKPNKL